MGTKASQRQFLVKASGITGFFATKTGGETSADVSEAWDGGSLQPEKLPSPASTSDITVGRTFDPLRDRQVIRELRPLVGRWRTTLSVQDTDADLVAIGPPTVYRNALLISMTEPDHDAASGDPAQFELTFGIEGVQ